MASVHLLLVHSHPSNHSSPISLQFRNPNFTSIKINTNQRPASTFFSPSKTPPHSSKTLRALDEDSNRETVQDGEVDSLGVKVALFMLRFYKREISPVLPKSCRYLPTCSEYSMEAYKRYGVVKGTVLTAWRICRCNPLGGFGYDPPRWFGEVSPREEIDD